MFYCAYNEINYIESLVLLRKYEIVYLTKYKTTEVQSDVFL